MGLLLYLMIVLAVLYRLRRLELLGLEVQLLLLLLVLHLLIKDLFLLIVKVLVALL